MTTTPERFQITREQAEIYEERFVPALFAHWVEPMLDAVGLGAGQSVLDVACGTGVLTRHAADRVGPDGRAVGLDLNQAMLDVASRIRPDVDWRRGDVAAIPFDDDSFDVVTCQAALFFFPDVTAALREMGRVARRNGRVGVQVFSPIGEQPAYGPWSPWWPGTRGRTRGDCSAPTGRRATPIDSGCAAPRPGCGWTTCATWSARRPSPPWRRWC